MRSPMYFRVVDDRPKKAPYPLELRVLKVFPGLPVKKKKFFQKALAKVRCTSKFKDSFFGKDSASGRKLKIFSKMC